MDWDTLNSAFAQYGLLDEQAVRRARNKLKDPVASDWEWLADALGDERKKRFVAAVFRDYPVPTRLFEPFLRAAVYEPDPDGNRVFVLPCVNSFGYRKVNERLLDYVEGHDNFEIAGAVAALYWATMQLEFPEDAPDYSPEYAKPECRSAYLELEDTWQRKRNTFLKVFVTNDDVTVRRYIMAQLELDEGLYPEELKPLVAQAIESARTHPDEYIHRRVEVQLGNELLTPLLPDRERRENE